MLIATVEVVSYKFEVEYLWCKERKCIKWVTADNYIYSNSSIP